ncbi:MAG: NAD-dependent epimerase/dehydratase family protein [Planctomycetota bacterium]|jgi:dihydroflavonol-4-reductase|nr:NAD-dependent epimerase/dehydratase family protein [Planctomycetota bacterium]MDP6764239.1 NAD-dependent epimerase/dehydratase family protein [Planctomycetota bacterium]MDP6990664.1 NAD-dependent epimerase/dehydratase family protein [Planctomycetota bacterium]
MLVLVTGAGGFLGGHVCAALAAEGHRVRAMVRPPRPSAAPSHPGIDAVEADLLDEAALRRALRGCDGVVHAAARTGYWSRQDDEQWRANVDGTAALLRAARAAQVARTVHVSSIATIGATRDGTPLDEDAVWQGPDPNRIHYVLTKREAEQRALAAAWAGMDVVVVNPGMLVGPPADGGPPRGMICAVASGRSRWAPPGGTSVADVEDVARGTAAALFRGSSGQRYILGGHNLTWLELQGTIARIAGVAPPRRVLPQALVAGLTAASTLLDAVGLARPPWTPELLRSFGWKAFVDSSRAERVLGYRTRPLEDTIRSTLALLRDGPDEGA